MNQFLHIIIFSIILFSANKARAFEVTPEIAATGLKTVVITTIGGEEPTCESIDAPAGSWGVGITNVNKVPGSVEVAAPDGSTVYSSGDYVKKESGMTVKVRGNTSARYAKKPYKVKLEKKGDLLGRGLKDLNDKNWVLLTTRSNLYELGFLIGEWIGMPWTPAYEYVHLVMNGEYRGVYILAEAVERNEKCRIRTEETGFVAERDAYWWNEDGQFLPSSWNPQFNWTLKYPDFEDLTQEQTDYISGVLAAYEDILASEDYEEIIDLDSYCKWVLAQDILGTSDGGGTNFYLARRDDATGSKLFVPVLWDVDSGEETHDAWSMVHSEPHVALLFNNANPAFRRRYIDLYNELAPAIFGKLEAMAREMRGSEWDGFNAAAELNNAVWGRDALFTSSHNAADMDEWFGPRKLWLDAAVARLEGEAGLTGAQLPGSDETPVEIFTLTGLRVFAGPEADFKPTTRGLYIVRSGSRSEKVMF